MLNSLSQRHVGGLQDLTGQPVGGPAYPSRNVANSSLPLCLLGEKEVVASLSMRRKPAPVQYLSL